MAGTKFETSLQVRPDDRDMNQNVYASRYLDYVLAARYDQMERWYQMPIEVFTTYSEALSRRETTENTQTVIRNRSGLVKVTFERLERVNPPIQSKLFSNQGPMVTAQPSIQDKTSGINLYLSKRAGSGKVGTWLKRPKP